MSDNKELTSHEKMMRGLNDLNVRFHGTRVITPGRPDGLFIPIETVKDLLAVMHEETHKVMMEKYDDHLIGKTDA